MATSDILSSYPAELRKSAGLSVEETSSLTDISARTIRRYESSGEASRCYLDFLHVRAHGLPISQDKRWRGWRFIRGRLVSPEGLEATPGSIRAMHFDRQLLESLKVQFKRWCDPGHQLEFWPGSELRAALTGRR